MTYAAGAIAARRAAFSGAIYQPADALALGFADELAAPEALLDTAIAHATRLATSIPAATFALTKRTLRSSVIQSGDLSEVMRIWEERSSDGWIRDYLDRTVRRP
jgi:enoyl-CoA hydratase